MLKNLVKQRNHLEPQTLGKLALVLDEEVRVTGKEVERVTRCVLDEHVCHKVEGARRHLDAPPGHRANA